MSENIAPERDIPTLVRAGYVLRAVREIQNFDAASEIMQDRELIASGAQVWPGNGETITEEEKENTKAGWTLLRMASTALGYSGRLKMTNSFDQDNPYLGLAWEAMDVAGLCDPATDKPPHTLAQANLALTGFFNGDKDVIDASIEELALPHRQAFAAEYRKARELFRSHGTQTVSGFDINSAQQHIDNIDFSSKAPDYLTESGTPAYNVGELLKGLPESQVDYPLYDALMQDQKYPEVFYMLSEDLRKLAGHYYD